MKRSIISVFLAVAVAVGGVTVYASSSKGWQAEQAAAQQQAAAVQDSAVPAAAEYNVVQAAPAETTVNTEAVYQPLCPYGHALVNGNMCAYPDCPNGDCYMNNNSYTPGGQCVNYDYAGNCGQGYQYGGDCYNYGHGGGHHGHGCGR